MKRINNMYYMFHPELLRSESLSDSFSFSLLCNDFFLFGSPSFPFSFSSFPFSFSSFSFNFNTIAFSFTHFFFNSLIFSCCSIPQTYILCLRFIESSCSLRTASNSSSIRFFSFSIAFNRFSNSSV